MKRAFSYAVTIHASKARTIITKENITMRTLFHILVYCFVIFDEATTAFIISLQRTPTRLKAYLLQRSARPNNEGPRTRHLYIPDDEDVLMTGSQDANGFDSTRRHPTSEISTDGHVYAGIPDEDLLMQESKEFEAFKWMNSNTHVQMADKTTAGRKITAAGSKLLALKHLYRYFTDICVDCWLSTVDPVDFMLSCNYTTSDLDEMKKTFPRLTSLDVKAYLSPHVRFIVRTLGGGSGDICDGQECTIDGDGFIPHNLQVDELGRTAVSPVFFGRRLEKTIAPRHAYMVHYGVHPHGRNLLKTGRFEEFLDACDDSSATFAHLCNQWSRKNVGPFSHFMLHTVETVEAFERSFHRGLLPFAQNKYSPDLDLIGCSPGKMVDLLLQHGANAIEHDRFGNSVLHWAAGSGNMVATKALIKFLIDAGEGQDVTDLVINTQGAKDGATPLHWAACGIKSGGGHASIVDLFLDLAGDQATELVDIECYSGSTPLMWAAWGGTGSLDVIKLLVSRGADPYKRNRQDAGLAHWAAEGGANLQMCRYLHDELHIRFDEEDKEGNTPFHLAESNGHQDIAEWIASLSDEEECKEDVEVSPDLSANRTLSNV